MKKLTLTFTIVLALAFGAMAQQGGGLFERGAVLEEASNDYNNRDGSLILPGSHGLDTDQNGPLGSGIAVLMGLGAAYVVAKKRREE